MEIKCLESILDMVKGNAPSESTVINILEERSSCVDKARLSLRSKEFIKQLRVQIPILNYEQLNIELRACLDWEQEFRLLSKCESPEILHWVLLQMYAQRLSDLFYELFETSEKDFNKLNTSAEHGSLIYYIHMEFIKNYAKAMSLILKEKDRILSMANEINLIHFRISKKSLRFLKEAMKRSNILTLHEKSLIFIYLKNSFKLMKGIRFDSISSEAKKQQHLDILNVEINIRVLINLYEKSAGKLKQLNSDFINANFVFSFKSQLPRNLLEALDRRHLKIEP